MKMLGRATAPLERIPRRWLQRIWGIPWIDSRQKWSLLWPTLGSLPETPMRLLDAGCGCGEFIQSAEMTVNIQYVGFQSKAIVREYRFLLRESSISPHEIKFTILNEAFHSHSLRYRKRSMPA